MAKDFVISLDCDAGWLCPKGDLYKCEWAEHLILAEEIIKQTYPEYYPDWTGYKYEHEPDSYLEQSLIQLYVRRQK